MKKFGGVFKISKKLLLFAVLILSLLVQSLPASAFSGTGSGGISDPYKVSTCQQLQDVQDDLDGYYIQTGDIDCSETETWNSGAGFLPIGVYESPFTGVYDGQGFTINNLHINAGDVVVGVFSFTDTATVRRINLRGGQVSSTNASESASLIGYATNTTISQCSSTVTTVGVRMSGLISTLTGSGSSVDRCWYDGSVTSAYGTTGYGYTSSLIGKVQNSATVTNVYSAGTFSYDGPYNGALIGGFFNDATISNAYSTVDVTMRNTSSGAYAGGLFGAGFSFGGGGTVTATDVYFAGSFDDGGAGSSGGIVGLQSDFDLSNVYYDSTKCGCSTEVGSYEGGSTDITDEADSDYFKGNSTNAPMDSWNFDTVWEVNEGSYPTFIAANAPIDSDTDNVNNSVEDYGPNGGDANNDGIKDSAQSNVASMVNEANLGSVVLEVNADSGCEIYDIASQTADEQSSQDIAYAYPLGLIDFHLSCDDAGATATIRQYYVDYENSSSYYSARKLINGVFTSIPGATLSDTTIDNNPVIVLTYQITDGGDLDSDGSVDKIIVDPAGLGVSTLTAPDTGLVNYIFLLTHLRSN